MKFTRSLENTFNITGGVLSFIVLHKWKQHETWNCDGIWFTNGVLRDRLSFLSWITSSGNTDHVLRRTFAFWLMRLLSLSIIKEFGETYHTTEGYDLLDCKDFFFVEFYRRFGTAYPLILQGRRVSRRIEQQPGGNPIYIYIILIFTLDTQDGTLSSYLQYLVSL
jgi:hypothetical protein